MEELRNQIKTWERAFLAKNGHIPSKEDIRNDKEIYIKYQSYRAYKEKFANNGGKSHRRPEKHLEARSDQSNGLNTMKPSDICDAPKTKLQNPQVAVSESNREDPPETPRKKKLNQSDLDAHRLETPTVKAMGPTPQINGRVMSLLDLSPVKMRAMPNRESTQAEEYVMSGEDESETDERESNPDMEAMQPPMTPKKRNALPVTPRKNSTPRSTAVMEVTPQYLRVGSRVTASDISPISHSKKIRGLSAILKEVDGMGTSDSAIDTSAVTGITDVLFASSGSSESENDDKDASVNPAEPNFKRRKPKRTTKLHNLKPNELEGLGQGKQGENYRRLKIHKGKKPPFRRR